jgi:hypothetical protein
MKGPSYRPQGGGRPATTTRYRTMKIAHDHPLSRDGDDKIYVHRKVLYDKLGPGEHPCHWCKRPLTWVGEGPRIHVDHLDNDTWNNTPDNLVPACNPCNARRTALTALSCPAGHPWTTDNTYIRPDTRTRQCRTCRAERWAEFAARRKKLQQV